MARGHLQQHHESRRHLPLSFGGRFFDCDNDGWLDLFIANGHVYPEVEQAMPGTLYKQISTLFHNENGKRFTVATESSGISDLAPAPLAVLLSPISTTTALWTSSLPITVTRRPSFTTGGNENHFANFRLLGPKAIATPWAIGFA